MNTRNVPNPLRRRVKRALRKLRGAPTEAAANRALMTLKRYFQHAIVGNRRQAVTGENTSRIVLNQTDSWHNLCTDSVYSTQRCCVCGRVVRTRTRALLRTARTNDGEWWVVAADCDLTADEWRDFQTDLAGQRGPTMLPIGPDCLRAHPEFRIGLTT